MKKINSINKIVALVGIFMILCLGMRAQNTIKIGDNTTTVNSSAQLEIESTNKGLLPPRMTTAQRNAISSPATGLVLYNTTTNCLQVNTGTPAAPIWQCTSGMNPTTGGTGEVSSYGAPSCAANVVNGSLIQGVPATGITMTLYANVTQLGSWNISTTSNGVIFSGSGTFTALGCQAITLTASGTPTMPGPDTFTLNTTPSVDIITTISAPLLATLDCAGATHNGTLTSGTAASGVSSVIAYTGGNGGAHSGQTVTSTGVTGLTATLSAGSFASGAGTLSYSITGTPASVGTATFAISIGGQSCNLTRSVAAAPTIATLDCAGATHNGTLTSGTAASGVSSVISYTGGNGAAHSGQTATSTGVTGLTATLSAGTFASGGGTLTYTITGTPASSGTATFAISIGGQSCNLTRSVAAAPTIATLNCAGATHNGTLNSGTAASGVSSVISYTGGNGAAHSGQTATSTGVTGLTATLSAGTFASGAGTLTYTITGTPASSGTATFAISIGGQSCNLTRSVSAPAPPSNPAGSGSFSGKTCFDIALGNDNTNSCGPLSARTATQANFTQSATHTQSYTFTPTGTVSNVRFLYINTTGSPVTAISGNNAGNNISTPVVATVNYVTTNAPFAGLTNANPHQVDIYVIYNDGATNNGTDRQLKLTANIKDCACCVAKVSATLWKEFLCHNLGANTSLDPHDMTQTNAWGLNGAYVQWGRRGPNTTGDSRVDWVTAANTTQFAAAPTAGTANDAAISGWNTTPAADFAWLTAGGAKTAADPCPSGFRVPTEPEWAGVVANNTTIYTGTWTDNVTNYGSSVSFGPNSTTKLLTLPAAGFRSYTGGGLLNNRGNRAFYHTSTENGAAGQKQLSVSFGSAATSLNAFRLNGYPVKCIAE